MIMSLSRALLQLINLSLIIDVVNVSKLAICQ